MSEVNKGMKGWAFVKNVADEQEAVLVESVLGIEGIPILRKHKRDGGFSEIFMGLSCCGIDLFVPEDALELAKGLLDSDVIEMPEDIGREEDRSASEKYDMKRRGIVWIILMYLFLSMAATIIWKIISKQ